MQVRSSNNQSRFKIVLFHFILKKEWLPLDSSEEIQAPILENIDQKNEEKITKLNFNCKIFFFSFFLKL